MKKIKISCCVSKTYEIEDPISHEGLNSILEDFQDCPVGSVAGFFKKEILD